jgi:hypothetical protein
MGAGRQRDRRASGKGVHTWRRIGVRVRVLAAAGEAEEVVVEAVGRGGGGRVMATGGDGGGRLVVEIAANVERRGRCHTSRPPRALFDSTYLSEREGGREGGRAAAQAAGSRQQMVGKTEARAFGEGRRRSSGGGWA